MADKSKLQPQLKNLNDLFSNMKEQSAYRQTVSSIVVDKLIPFDGHPFSLYEGERFDDMVESIRTNGILVPIIVRRVGEIFEILAGHNRVNAAKAAGMNEVPAIILENISDEDALVYVVETNLIQRSFADMAHSEKAAVIALHHSKMFSQGKRNDILEQLKMLESPHGYEENETLSQVGTKLRTDEKIGEVYNLSRNTIARYLRIQELTSELKSRLDNNNIAFMPAVTLSFLKESEQQLLNECMEEHGLSVDMKKADALRQLSDKGKLNKDSIYRILSGEITQKAKQTLTVKISKATYAKYFRPDQSAKEIQQIIYKALEMYFEL